MSPTIVEVQKQPDEILHRLSTVTVLFVLISR